VGISPKREEARIPVEARIAVRLDFKKPQKTKRKKACNRWGRFAVPRIHGKKVKKARGGMKLHKKKLSWRKVV